MQTKDLTKKLSSEPQLLYYYKRAIEDVYGVIVRVKKDTHKKFISKEKELLEKNVAPKDFAYGVAILLEKWVKSKKMHAVPVNVFLGEWAWNRFMKVHNSFSVSIDKIDVNEDVNLLWSEILVAKSYIQANLVEHKKLRDVVEDLRPLLSEAWLEAYKNGNRTKIELQVVAQLEEEYLLSNVSSYSDIVTQLVLNGHS